MNECMQFGAVVVVVVVAFFGALKLNLGGWAELVYHSTHDLRMMTNEITIPITPSSLW